MSDERIYPCDKCGALRSKAEGGTVFTVCDRCWDARDEKPPMVLVDKDSEFYRLPEATAEKVAEVQREWASENTSLREALEQAREALTDLHHATMLSDDCVDEIQTAREIGAAALASITKALGK
jgi:hypothetical protein